MLKVIVTQLHNVKRTKSIQHTTLKKKYVDPNEDETRRLSTNL